MRILATALAAVLLAGAFAAPASAWTPRKKGYVSSAYSGYPAWAAEAFTRAERHGRR